MHGDELTLASRWRIRDKPSHLPRIFVRYLVSCAGMNAKNGLAVAFVAILTLLPACRAESPAPRVSQSVRDKAQGILAVEVAGTTTLSSLSPDPVTSTLTQNADLYGSGWICSNQNKVWVISRNQDALALAGTFVVQELSSKQSYSGVVGVWPTRLGISALLLRPGQDGLYELRHLGVVGKPLYRGPSKVVSVAWDGKTFAKTRDGLNIDVMAGGVTSKSLRFKSHMTGASLNREGRHLVVCQADGTATHIDLHEKGEVRRLAIRFSSTHYAPDWSGTQVLLLGESARSRGKVAIWIYDTATHRSAEVDSRVVVVTATTKGCIGLTKEGAIVEVGAAGKAQRILAPNGSLPRASLPGAPLGLWNGLAPVTPSSIALQGRNLYFYRAGVIRKARLKEPHLAK